MVQAFVLVCTIYANHMVSILHDFGLASSHYYLSGSQGLDVNIPILKWGAHSVHVGVKSESADDYCRCACRRYLHTIIYRPCKS